MKKQHVIRCWPKYFRLTLEGKKPFEIRVNDRDYKPGDEIQILEYDPWHKVYTGAALAGIIWEVLLDVPGVMKNHAVLFVDWELVAANPIRKPGLFFVIQRRGGDFWGGYFHAWTPKIKNALPFPNLPAVNVAIQELEEKQGPANTEDAEAFVTDGKGRYARPGGRWVSLLEEAIT